MLFLLELAFLALAWVAQASAHDPFILDSRRAEPGPVRLELVEISRTPSLKYRLSIFGLPSQVVFGLFAKDFSDSFHEISTDVRLDGNSVRVKSKYGDQLQRIEEVVVEPGPYPKGAAWEIAVMSADRSIRAFTKVIPHPIMARDGGCMVSLELISQTGDRFVASGNGFAPGEEVVSESRYSGRLIQKRQKISAEGVLAPITISHRAPGLDRNARYTVKAQSCEVTVTYQWGERAIARQ